MPDGSGVEAGAPAAGLLRGGPFLGLLAETFLLLALAFVGFGLRLGFDGPVLAVLTQMRVRLAAAPAVVAGLPPTGRR